MESHKIHVPVTTNQYIFAHIFTHIFPYIFLDYMVMGQTPTNHQPVSSLFGCNLASQSPKAGKMQWESKVADFATCNRLV